MEDQIAISRLKQGDLDGLETLVIRYQVQAVHAAYLILYDRSLAEDVVQTAFVKAAQRIHQFEDGRPFGPWFSRIVVNDALKLAKKQERSVSLDEDQDDATIQIAKWLTDPDPNPEQLVEQKETRQVILKAIQSLPPGQRAVIVMKYFYDMRMSDMSMKTGRPLSTIKWWLRDARKRLRGLMEPSKAPRGDRSQS
ncbi:MAG: sigma-70 family RNA polymerase sigma factor [Anaerolineales bacterium]|nr:sigma-70 family RNA polymerase sigma factor [Anaerolineales bacterium]